MPNEQIPAGENYKNVERSLGKIIVNNFIGGIFWSLGAIIGTTIIVSAIAYFVSRVDVIPILGHFIAEVLKSSQEALKGR